MMWLKRLPLALLVSLTPSSLPADEHVVAPRGEYARIDVRLANKTIAALSSGTDTERKRAIEAIEAAPQKYAPPVFYLLSNTLFTQGRKDDGAFWFYAGQLRARFDANRCADVSARQAVAVLNQEYGTPINQYMFKDLPKLEALIPKVVEWDRKTPHDYDHRWINLHGMAAMIEGLEGSSAKREALSLPRAQWDAIAEKTRSDYVEAFRKAVETVAKERAATPPPTVRAEPGWEKRLLGSWKQEMSSILRHFPKQFPGVKDGDEAGRRAAADLQRVEWTVGPDTITLGSALNRRDGPAPPYQYRIAKVEGNVATLEGTYADGSPLSWTVEYLEPGVIRLMQNGQEVYRLRRVGAPAAPERP